MGLKPFHQVSLLLGCQHLFLHIIVSISFSVLLLAGFSSSWLAWGYGCDCGCGVAGDASVTVVVALVLAVVVAVVLTGAVDVA